MIERVIKYSVSMQQDKSLLYTTSSDLSLIFGYYLPISKHAMRVCNDMEFISKYEYKLETFSSAFINRTDKQITGFKNLLVEVVGDSIYNEDMFYIHVPYDCDIFINETVAIETLDCDGIHSTSQDHLTKTKNKLESLESYSVYRENGKSNIHILDVIGNLSTYERLYPFYCGYLMKSDRDKPSIFTQHKQWHLSSKDKVPFYNYKPISLNVFDKYSNYDDYHFLNNKDKRATLDESQSFINLYTNGLYYSGDAFYINNMNSNVDCLEGTSASRIVGQIDDYNTFVFLDGSSKNLSRYGDYEFLDTTPVGIVLKNEQFDLSSGSSKSNYIDIICGLLKHDLGAFSNKEDAHARQQSKDGFYFTHDIAISQDKSKVYGKTDHISLGISPIEITPTNMILFAKTLAQSLKNDNDNYFISKHFKSILLKKDMLYAYKDNAYEISVNSSSRFLSKIKTRLVYNDGNYHLGKGTYLLSYDDGFLSLGKSGSRMYTVADYVYLGKSEFSTGSIYSSSLISKYYKSLKDGNTTSFLWKDTSRKSRYKESNEHIYKLYDGVYGYDFTDIVSKGSYNIWLRDYNLSMEKVPKQTLVTEDAYLIQKDSRSVRDSDSDLFNVYKVAKPFDASLFVSHISKIPYPIMESRFLSYIEKNKVRRIFCTEYYSIDYGRFDARIDDNVLFLDETSGLFANETLSTARTDRKRVDYPRNDNEFLKISEFRHIDLNQIDQTSITSDSVPDKYITTNYKALSGIDELILPHSDFDYTVYESSLILNGTINPSYIKKVEDGNVYIKYPIENPIKPFADIATLYMDVPVNTVEYVIKKAYSIWRERIFTYSGMKPDGAIRDLVKRVYENLELHFVDDKELYQAYRVARLFRWYSEMSILNNSEYMLKLNCKDIRPDYVNIDIEDLRKNIELNNLDLSSDLLIESVSEGKKASIVISCEKYHTLYITTKMYIYDGYVESIVNGKNTVYTEEYTELNIEVPVGKSKVEIVFYPFNQNSKVQFAQFEITNFHIESYSIIYNGKVGESNKTIEYLINTLVIAEDAMTNMQANIAMATPIVNALDNMRRYFDLHHEDKSKGKRLINKFL